MGVRNSVLALALLVSACTTDAGDQSAVEPPGGPESADRSPSPYESPTSSAHLIPCAESVGTIDVPSPDLIVVENVVAVAGPRQLQVAATTVNDIGGAVLFAKAGLLVRPGHSVELRVGESEAGRAWLGWGTPAEPRNHVRLDACDHPGAWLAFAGGYWVKTARCVRVLVAVDGGPWRHVSAPVDAACPDSART